MAGKAPMWASKSSRVSVEIPHNPDLIGRMEASALRRRQAEGIAGRIEPSEEHIRLLAIGCRAVEQCPRCMAVLPCDLHSLEALKLVRGSSKAKRAADVDEQRGREHALVMAKYSEAFKEARSKKPSIGGAEGKAVKDALETYGIEVILEAIEGAFADPFWAPKVTIRGICSNPDQFRKGKETKTEARQTR